MSSRTAEAAHPVSPWRRRLISLGVILALGGFVWSQLPKGGYPTDLSVIGQGQAVLVLARDDHYLGGAEVMALMSRIRPDFSGQVQFLVAPLALPDARNFAGRHNASDGTVLLFAGDGRRVAVLHQPQSEDELRQALRQAFGI